MAFSYGIDAFLILVPSTKKTYSSCLKKAFVFEEICFKIKVLKMFKISFDCLKRKIILKLPGTVF